MKIPGAADIRNWDQYTIQHEPVASIDLMERAAIACTKWISDQVLLSKPISIFCGKGNNGGDGLAISRLLAEKGLNISVCILEFGHLGTEDFQANLARAHQYPHIEIRFIQTEENFPPIEKGSLIIDALIGSGLNRKLESVTAALVDHLNKQSAIRVAIDIPSGMFVESSSAGNTMIIADHTLSFQCYKPAFLVPENGPFIGQVHILDIGLHPGYYDQIETTYELIDEDIISAIYQPRKSYTHKGDHGHGLVIAGGYGKTGAAILCARACLRSGVGLLSCHVPKSSYDIMQSTVPEAMTFVDMNSFFLTKIDADMEKYDALGIGPGIGTTSETRSLIKEIILQYKRPMVIDADGLNILGMQKELLARLIPGSILTPHPKEFERLFGETKNDFERIELAKKKANELNVIIILKGHHTLVAIPGEKLYFNSTGNAGMATGGSGDVLTGIVTALLSQGYSPGETALLGVYLHGLAGDLAKENVGEESMIASDIIDHLAKAFAYISSIKG